MTGCLNEGSMDAQIVIRAQSGDRAAFAAIIESSYARLQQVAYRILRDPHLAEDATQQTLLEVWRTLPRLRDPARFEAWSYRTLVRLCYREASKSRQAFALAQSGDPVVRDELGTVGDRDLLEFGFRQLSLDHRTVVVLHHYVGMTLDDIAEALDVPVGTVNSRLSRAMAKLRDALLTDHTDPQAATQELSR